MIPDDARRALLDSFTFTEGTIRMSLHSDATRAEPPDPRDRPTETWREAFPDGLPVPASKALTGVDLDDTYDGVPDPDRALERVGPRQEPDRPGWTPLSPELPPQGLQLFQELLEQVTYKPGYRFRVDHDWLEPRLVVFTIVARLANTYRPSEVGDVAMRFTVPPWLLERWAELPADRAEDRMLRWVRKCLGWHELHERDEWIRLDGEMRFDPHKGLPPGSLRLRP